MSNNTIATIEKYMPEFLDEVYTLNSLTAPMLSNPDVVKMKTGLTGAGKVHIKKISVAGAAERR